VVGVNLCFAGALVVILSGGSCKSKRCEEAFQTPPEVYIAT